MVIKMTIVMMINKNIIKIRIWDTIAAIKVILKSARMA